jgi:hypothetical protein
VAHDLPQNLSTKGITMINPTPPKILITPNQRVTLASGATATITETRLSAKSTAISEMLVSIPGESAKWMTIESLQALLPPNHGWKAVAPDHFLAAPPRPAFPAPSPKPEPTTPPAKSTPALPPPAAKPEPAPEPEPDCDVRVRMYEIPVGTSNDRPSESDLAIAKMLAAGWQIVDSSFVADENENWYCVRWARNTERDHLGFPVTPPPAPTMPIRRANADDAFCAGDRIRTTTDFRLGDHDESVIESGAVGTVIRNSDDTRYGIELDDRPGLKLFFIWVDGYPVAPLLHVKPLAPEVA